MDRALRGNRLTKQPKRQQPSPRMGQAGPDMTRQPPKKTQEERDEDYAALGRYVTGIEGKPHSNIEGQKYAGARFLTRMWYGRGKKKKKGFGKKTFERKTFKRKTFAR